MSEYKQINAKLLVMCLSLVIFLASGIAALCLLHSDVTIWGVPLVYLLAGVAALFLLVYLIVLCTSFKVKKQGKSLLELSFELTILSVLLFVLLPVVLIMLVVEAIAERISDGRARRELK